LAVDILAQFTLSVNEVMNLFQQQASVTAFQDAFGVSTVLGLLSIISALFLYQRKSKKTAGRR